MTDILRPTGAGQPSNYLDAVPRAGMYSGQNYTGGQNLAKNQVPSPALWQVVPVGFPDLA